MEFLLVHTSDGERWTFPKGGCDGGETPFVLEVAGTCRPAEPLRNPTWFGFEAARSRLAEARAATSGAQMERLLLAAHRAACK